MSITNALFRAPVTMIAIVVCVIIYISQSNGQNTNKYSYQYFQVKQGQYYRLLTAGFLHATPMHLLMNMYSLYNLGTYLEAYYLGSVRFLILLVGGIIAGNLFCYLLKVRAAVGISGGLYALMMLYITLILLYTNTSMITIVRLNFVNILINFLPGIAWQAHVGGGIFGILMALLFFFI